ncbi:hypothetical protein Tco_1556525 [Tanacetum coccineum]
MSWRHPSFAIDDPQPPVGSYNQEDVHRISAHVVKLRDIHKGVLVLSGLSRIWKTWTCDSLLWDFDVNGTEGEGVWLAFYYTPLTAANAAIPDPTLEDLAASTPSAKVLAKAEASMKQKVFTSGASSSHVAKRTSDDDEDAYSRGKSIMTDAAGALSGSASHPRPSSSPTPEGGVAGFYEFSHEEWDAPHQSTLSVLISSYGPYEALYPCGLGLAGFFYCGCLVMRSGTLLIPVSTLSVFLT